MRAALVTPAAALLAVAIALLFVWRGGDAPLHAAEAPAPAAPPDERAPAPVAVALPAIAAASTAPAGTTWLLPDGSRVAALNGAVDPKPLADAWPAGVPWSPIIGVERSAAGIDWYVHADGSKSTTERKWRADLGREDAVTRLARPAPQAPAVAPR